MQIRANIQGVQYMKIAQDHILRELEKNLQKIDTLVQFGAKSFKNSPNRQTKIFVAKRFQIRQISGI